MMDYSRFSGTPDDEWLRAFQCSDGNCGCQLDIARHCPQCEELYRWDEAHPDAPCSTCQPRADCDDDSATKANSDDAAARAEAAEAEAASLREQVRVLGEEIEKLNISALVLHGIGALNLSHCFGEMQHVWDARETMREAINTQKQATIRATEGSGRGGE